MKSRLVDYRRIVIKIGSSLIVERETGLKREWLLSLCEDIADLIEKGTQIIVVSSGAIALGRSVLNFSLGALKLEESQAAAAAGQIELGRAFCDAFGRRHLSAGQILLTLEDTEQRRRYLNARATVETLLRFGAVPVINENDSVATSEIRYGDNDRLAARVASMVGADLLILLSDVDGLYSAPPSTDISARFIDQVREINFEIEAMAGEAGSQLSRGGMVTKIEAAKIATAAGSNMIIASGQRKYPLSAIDDGVRCTWFPSQESPGSAWKKWIAAQLQIMGNLTIDQGAIVALNSGKSLLPAGIIHVSGAFQRGDTVTIAETNGYVLGRGIIAYDAEDAKKIIGHKSKEIANILGFSGRTEMIHRDDMVLAKPVEMREK